MGAVKVLETAPALAPDGQPWPQGYFDAPVKITIDQAIEAHGIRPSHYYRGRPIWTEQDRKNPAYRSTLPEEPPEVIAQWNSAAQNDQSKTT